MAAEGMVACFLKASSRQASVLRVSERRDGHPFNSVTLMNLDSWGLNYICKIPSRYHVM